jgi:hypothetical protein
VKTISPPKKSTGLIYITLKKYSSRDSVSIIFQNFVNTYLSIYFLNIWNICCWRNNELYSAEGGSGAEGVKIKTQQQQQQQQQQQ